MYVIPSTEVYDLGLESAIMLPMSGDIDSAEEVDWGLLSVPSFDIDIF